MGISNREEWFTLDDITLMDKEESKDKLYCISVDSPEKQFLIGEIGVPTHNTDEAKIADELKGESIMIIVSTCFSITTKWEMKGAKFCSNFAFDRRNEKIHVFLKRLH